VSSEASVQSRHLREEKASQLTYIDQTAVTGKSEVDSRLDNLFSAWKCIFLYLLTY